MSPAEAGRRLAREHATTHPLTERQIDAAARVLAAVARERAQGSADVTSLPAKAKPMPIMRPLAEFITNRKD